MKSSPIGFCGCVLPRYIWLLLCGCVLQSAAKSFEEHKWRDGIQVWQSSRKGREIMWGRCNGWFHKLKSCILPPDTTCSAHLSEGPADADVEVRLGNLPVFDRHPTFVQWWAARKSESEYDPLKHPEDATLYDDMFQAYPRYYDPDFNGGNVQVNANGEAVIKFRAPSTHRIGKDARVPHVHIRICSSGQTFSIILGRRDKIQLTSNGLVAKSECNTQENKLHVLSYRHLKMPSLKGLLKQGLMTLADRAWEKIDLDALEFSPVFQCLSAKMLYDHIEGDCADTCSDGSVLTHGQCVKPASSMQSFSAMWDLHVCGCDERCWADKKHKTMHRLRLEIAEHMDIPLHEVHELDMSFTSGEYPNEASVARMHIHIRSPRHTMETGTSMLRSLFYNMERSSEVLAMLVLHSKEISARDLGFLHKRVTANSEDAYLPYYHDLEIVKKSTPPSASEEVAPSQNAAGMYDSAYARSLCMFLAMLSLIVVVKCAFPARKKVASSASKGLGQPLTPSSPSEDPELFQGRHPAASVMPLEQPENQKMPTSVEQYLVTVYARALCGCKELEECGCKVPEDCGCKATEDCGC